MALRLRGLGEEKKNMQTRTEDRFANNYWVQMAAMIIVLAVVIEIAAKHIW